MFPRDAVEPFGLALRIHGVLPILPAPRPEQDGHPYDN
jgi:hypothetical protein